MHYRFLISLAGRDLRFHQSRCKCGTDERSSALELSLAGGVVSSDRDIGDIYRTSGGIRSRYGSLCAIKAQLQF